VGYPFMKKYFNTSIKTKEEEKKKTQSRREKFCSRGEERNMNGSQYKGERKKKKRGKKKALARWRGREKPFTIFPRKKGGGKGKGGEDCGKTPEKRKKDPKVLISGQRNYPLAFIVRGRNEGGKKRNGDDAPSLTGAGRGV